MPVYDRANRPIAVAQGGEPIRLIRQGEDRANDEQRIAALVKRYEASWTAYQALPGDAEGKVIGETIAAKRALEAAGISCTGTVAVLEDNQQVANFKPSRDMPDAWAIKPARGSQGDGILLAVRREGNTWFKGSGAALPEDMVMHLKAQTLVGVPYTDEMIENAVADLKGSLLKNPHGSVQRAGQA